MELKAPAGTLTSALAALDAGADSVFVGLSSTSHQRNQLANLDAAELTRLCAIAARRGRQVVVTLNSTVEASAWQAQDDTLRFLAEIGVHGVILSDIGFAAHVAEHHPALKILFSVQGECANARHAKLLAEVGVHRVVLERNVSAREARRIKAAAGIEVELFVFGYTCNSHDSLCYMGDYWSGSPCNVHCAQKVQFLDVPGLDAPRRYLFMQYYSALRVLPELADAGIDGLKIEGRQRSSDFVRRSTAVFRAAIDALAACRAEGRPFHVEQAWIDDLREAAMAFEVTDGFFVPNTYRRTVLDDPSVGTVLRYAEDTLRNLREGQTSLEFLRRSLVRHVQRGLSKPELGGQQVRRVPGV